MKTRTSFRTLQPMRTLGGLTLVWAAAGFGLTLCIWTKAGAQATVDASSSTRNAPKWFAALGTDPFDFDLRTRDPGVQGQLFGTLGRDWSRRASGLGFRTQLTVGADLPRGLGLRQDTCPGCEVRYTRSFGAVAGFATHHWRRDRVIQPYVVGGPSLHVARTGFTVRGVLTQTAAAEVPLPPPATRWSLGVSSGMGVAFQMGSSTLFIEQSIQLPDALTAPPGGSG